MPEHIKWRGIHRGLLIASGWACLMLVSRNLFEYSRTGAVSIVLVSDWGSGKLLFLSWNLFLAWIPFWLALALARRAPEQRFQWPALPLWGLWLLFLPNAPYLLTDLIHLRPRPLVPVWYDAGLFFSFAAIGWGLGISSLLLAERLLRERFGSRLIRPMAPLVLGLCAFGVPFGRILRWNSWDAITRPAAVGRDVMELIFQPHQHLGYWAMTFMLFGMLLVSYKILAGWAGLKAQKQFTR